VRRFGWSGATGGAGSGAECSIARVKRLLALLAGGLGIGALLRRRTRLAGDAPADELRAKLAANRDDAEPEPEGTAPDLNGRRTDVHERARRAIDELREP